MAVKEASNRGPVHPPFPKAETGGERPPGMVEVNVSTAAELDQALEDAIAVVTEAAVQHHIGILVTRMSAGRYIVRAHPAVPFGLVRQQHG